jgi:hypothetical protein
LYGFSLRLEPSSQVLVTVSPASLYLVAVALIVGLVTPALAEQFYVAFDPASHKCTMMHNIPSGSMKNMGGPYKTRAEAKKAMHGMKECTA